jgi:hypothetical protein
MDWTALDPVKINISLERLDLTTESVTAYRDVERAKGLLILSAVQHMLSEQDHSGARAVRR